MRQCIREFMKDDDTTYRMIYIQRNRRYGASLFVEGTGPSGRGTDLIELASVLCIAIDANPRRP